MSIKLRQATKSDIPSIIELIKELALYEKAPHEVTITPEMLERDGFGEHPLFWVILAEENNEVLGMSFYYIRYSTWKGPCLYLEDIIVKEQQRGRGIGKMLMDATIEKAKEMKVALMVWQVLNWNEPAINFYKKYNAEFDDEWVNCKIRF
ncbi:MAG: GNAT family N-acetyltransferase [Bacteroidia bacterium]